MLGGDRNMKGLGIATNRQRLASLNGIWSLAPNTDAQHTMREVAARHEKFGERVEQHPGAQGL